MPTASTLTYDTLKAAVAGSAAAFRLRLKLSPAGGDGDKMFPPTYEGGRYIEELRRIPGHSEPVLCVLLDSVQSQANRMEMALQKAWKRKTIKLPVIVVNLDGVDHPTLTEITSLQAPHRVADAILRDSLRDGVYFRESDIGKELDKLSVENATPLLTYCPTALLFGMWDSTYKRGGLGVKYARCITSEIIGINAQIGSKAALRQDPIQIKKNAVETIYRSDGEFWTLDPKQAKLDKSKKPVKFGDGSPSSIVHGNIPTKITDGGYTIEEAEQITVLSLPSIRRLQFPISAHTDEEEVAQTYVAALGLLATTLTVESGYSLRSRCELVVKGAVEWDLLGSPGEPPTRFKLTGKEATALYEKALAGCVKAGYSVETNPIELKPSEKFKTLIEESVVRWASDMEGKD